MYAAAIGSSRNATNIPDIGNAVQYEEQWSFSFFNNKRDDLLQFLIMHFCDLRYATFMIGNIESIQLRDRYIIDGDMMFGSKLPDLIYIFTYGFCIQINAVQRLASTHSFDYCFAANDERTFFGSMLLTEIFHDAKKVIN